MTENLFDPNPFRETLDKMQPLLLGYDDPAERARAMAVASHVPVIAVTSYVMLMTVVHTKPQMEALQAQLARLLDYYNFTGVKPWLDLPYED